MVWEEACSSSYRGKLTVLLQVQGWSDDPWGGKIYHLRSSGHRGDY
jgi:hypothetical protein